MIETSSVVRDEAAVPAPGGGEVVSAKYRLLRPLGEGGMGLVFEAEHLRLRQSVAIKFLRPEVLALPDALERFEREARASARIRGPHVVRVLDVDTDERGRPYMVMELLRGRDLEAELRAQGPLTVEAAVDLVLQACVAVAQAHAAGVVHRDLKPSNLFLTEESGKRVLKVLDFGISKTAPDADASVTSMCVTVGTPLYMSPEQMRSSRDVDGRTDIWSLGVILYELVAGAPPFLGTTTAAIAAIVADAMPSLRRVRPDVPEALERVLVTALAKDPADRLPTAEALAAALMPFASADGLAGPFSLRPSQRDFALASSAMARTPTAARVRDSAELLGLPPSRGRQESTSPVMGAAIDAAAPREPHARRSREALRTFGGTLVIGMGLASAMTILFPRTGAPSPAGARGGMGPSIAAPTPRSHASTPGWQLPSGPTFGPRVGAIAAMPVAAPEVLSESDVRRRAADTPPDTLPSIADDPTDGARIAETAALGELGARPKSLSAHRVPPPAGAVRLPPPRRPDSAPAASDRPHRGPPSSPYL
jgi:serine/threonine-protein kinase